MVSGTLHLQGGLWTCFPPTLCTWGLSLRCRAVLPPGTVLSAPGVSKLWHREPLLLPLGPELSLQRPPWRSHRVIQFMHKAPLQSSREPSPCYSVTVTFSSCLGKASTRVGACHGDLGIRQGRESCFQQDHRPLLVTREAACRSRVSPMSSHSPHTGTLNAWPRWKGVPQEWSGV